MEFLFGLFIVLSIIAIMYLLVNGLGLNEFLPKTLTRILVKISVTIIITAIPLGVYDIVGVAYFGKIAIAVFVIGLFFTIKDLFYGKIKMEYRKKAGVPASEDEWICKKCGEANYKINKECIGCKSINR